MKVRSNNKVCPVNDVCQDNDVCPVNDVCLVNDVCPVNDVCQDNAVAEEIESRMTALRDDAEALHLMRFFKCGKGEYGEGDRFLGIRVPRTREVVKEYRNSAEIPDTLRLVNSPWHEVRLAGFLLMKEIYKRRKKHSEQDARIVVDSYLASLDRANNWDLVDLSADILGDWLVTHPEDRHILYGLSDVHGNLWHQRVAIVATFMLIRNGEYSDTFAIAERYLTHAHDLIHKATGWMLRETGKRGGHGELCGFLDRHAPKMPRTMLRYAIEKFPEPLRQYYLKL